MIELTVQEMLNSFNTLQDLLDKKLPSKTAFTVARIIREIEKESNTFQTARNHLIKLYGEVDKNGNLITDAEGNIQVKNEDIPAFNKEITDLLNTTITLNIDKINITDLNNLDFTPRQFLFLHPFIQE